MTRDGKLLSKLEDFRFLPAFVALSMAIGIAIGKWLRISDFPLTPPIDAIAAIWGGRFVPDAPHLLSLGVPLGLFAMMYPAMTNVRLDEAGRAFRSPRQLGVVVAFNYLVAPFLMLLLADIFVSDPQLRTGLVLYGLAPCIAMVIVFTYIAKGNTPMALAFVAINAVIQMILIPVYARLLLGGVTFDVWVVAESVVLYLGLPLVAGIATRHLVVQRGGEAAMERLKPTLSALSILGLLFTLIVMFSLKGDLILDRPIVVVQMAIPMTIFFGTMFFAAYFIASRLGFGYEDSVAVAFNSTGRDFEIAIAIAITAFSSTVALATVVGPLIEVPVMLALVWGAQRLRGRLFRERAPSPAPTSGKKLVVLFACVGNSARSQMAEGFARAYAGDRIDVRSGGSRPMGRVLPEAITVMRERGIDISTSQSKGFDEAWVRDACDLVVTMGCGDDACPAFVGKRLVDWGIEDPKEKDLATFRRVRDEIEERVRALTEETAARLDSGG